MNKFWRVGLSLFITFFVGFWLILYLDWYYHDLHIKSTDSELKDNLTHGKVLLDIAITMVVAAVIPAVVVAWIYRINKVEGVARSGKVAAIACACFLFDIIIYLSIYHYRETSIRMEDHRQWLLQQQRR